MSKPEKAIIAMLSATCALGPASSAQAQGAAGEPYTMTFGITATEGGPFSISAVVTPEKINQKTQAAPTQALPLSVVPPVTTQPLDKQDSGQKDKPQPAQQPTFTREQVDKIVQDLTREMEKQQKQLAEQFAKQNQEALNKFAQQQAATANQLAQQQNAAINQLAQQQNAAITRLGQQQQQMQQLQNFAQRAFFQWQRDNRLRRFENALAYDPYLRGAFDPYRRNDLLSAVRDMLGAAAMASQLGQAGRQNQPQGPTADEIAQRLQASLGDKLSQDAADKVLKALKESAAQDRNEDQMKDQITRFAQLNSKLENLVGSKGVLAGKADSLSTDDYESLTLMSENVDDVKSKADLLELAMEAAGRVSNDRNRDYADRQRARNFTWKIRTKFEVLRGQVADNILKNQIESDIERCSQIAT